MAKILIADENTAAAAVLSDLVSAEEHEVFLATNGKDAYDLVLLEKPDLVFLAKKLPVFSGLETSRMIREDPEAPSRLPVILLAVIEEDSRTTKKAGITDVLPSHYSASQVRDLLVKHLGDKARAV